MGILGDTFRAGAHEVDRLEAELAERDRIIAERDATIRELRRRFEEEGTVPPPLGPP